MLPWLVKNSPELISDVRETSLGKLVRDEMLALILRGEYAPGQRINEPDVAARLRVSRVPVREALRELESSGLVAARKHSGVFVRELDSKEVADLYEVRSVLDGHAAYRAAQLPASPRRMLVHKLHGLLKEMTGHERNRDVQAYYGNNLGFHWAIIVSADNELLKLTYRGVVQQLHLSRLKNLSRDMGMHLSILEHEQIVDALNAGEAERCRGLSAQHVMASHGRLIERLEMDTP
jgi:DNA-binding GntR family transcriptional regulator